MCNKLEGDKMSQCKNCGISFPRDYSKMVTILKLTFCSEKCKQEYVEGEDVVNI